MSYVVVGATGHLGRLVVESLLERGVDPAEVVATGRSVERIADLAERGVRVERFDFGSVPETVPWLAAGDVLLLVSGSEVGRRVPQHQAVTDLARRAGVARLVYTSAPAADDTALVVAPEHAATEALIRESGLPFTFLRNGWYTENYRTTFDQARATGVVAGSAGRPLRERATLGLRGGGGRRPHHGRPRGRRLRAVRRRRLELRGVRRGRRRRPGHDRAL